MDKQYLAKNRELESKICRFLDETIIDDESFSIVALNVARFALNNLRRLESMKEWAKTVVRLSTNGGNDSSSEIEKHVDSIVGDDSVVSAFVYLSDGDKSIVFKRGENDDISVNLSEISEKDNHGVVYGVLSCSLVNMLTDNPQLFSNFKKEIEGISDDFAIDEIEVPQPQECEYDDNDLDVVISI